MSAPATIDYQPIPDAVDDTVQVVLRPNLNRDFAGFMTMLFVIIAYHIQHPTLLAQVQFGRSFRGDSLQEAIAVALMIAGLFLMGPPRRLWENRNSPGGWLKLAMVATGMLFTVHVLAMIGGGFNIFQAIYGLDAEFITDTFKDKDFLLTMQVLNTTAVLFGAAFVSIIYLWSPWELASDRENSRPAIEKSAAAILALLSMIAAYVFQHPIWGADSGSGGAILAGIVLLASVGYLGKSPFAMTPLHRAMFIIVGLFTLHALAVILAGYNVFSAYYGVEQAMFAQEPLNDVALHDGLRALELAAMLGGAALISAFYLTAPWERLKLYRDVAMQNSAALLVTLGALLVWEGVINIFEIEQFLLPRPSVIMAEFKDSYPKLIASGWFTFQNALFGYLVGCGAGILTGFFSARFVHFSRAALPLAIAANAVPIIAFAPITNQWFGVTSINSKVAIVAVLCYFPPMISTVRGLITVETIQLELMRSYAATEMEIFRALRMPNALPLVFSALKLCTTLAMIAAIVAEFFGGSLKGIGYGIREDAALFRFPDSWSKIMMASFFGIGFYLLISSLERAAMPWYQSFRSEN